MVKFRAKIKKVGDAFFVQLPEGITSRKAFSPKAKLLVEVTFLNERKMGGTAEERKTRDREILKCYKEGATLEGLCVRFGLTEQTISNIIEDMLELSKNNSLSMYFGNRIMDTIKYATGLHNPSVEQFREYVETHKDWRETILLCTTAGPEILGKIEDVCKKQGIWTR